MDTASFQFVIFGLAAALVSNIKGNSHIWRSSVLMLASIAFLGVLAHNPVALLPLVGFLLLGYAGLSLLERGWPKPMVWSILAVIFAYIWLKKYTCFARRNLSRVSLFHSWTLLHLLSRAARSH
jgi:hypothetical protein